MQQNFTGIKFYIDTLDLNVNDVFAAFSFYSGSRNNNLVFSEKWAVNAATGILNKIGSFSSITGSGFFDGGTYLTLNKNYSLNDSTIFISYSKLRSGDEVLLSSATGNNFSNYSGFCLGINDANKLYFKYWNSVEGPFTFTYSKILSDKNLIILNRNSNNLNLGVYNNNSFDFDIEQFDIYENNFINSKILNIGGKPNYIEWLNTAKNFSGYIDKLYIFNNDIFFVYKNNIVSGLFSLVTGSESTSSYECYPTGYFKQSGYLYWEVTGTRLSGYQTGNYQITGYRTEQIQSFYIGVTGYENILVGNNTDNCGNNIDIYDIKPLSGTITITSNVLIPLSGMVYSTIYVEFPLSGLLSGNVIVPITGLSCNEVIEITGGFKSIIDKNYLSSLSYKEITLFSQIIEDDVVEIYTENYNNKTLDYNKNLTYNNLNKNHFYIDKIFAQNEILLFGNGRALIDSGYYLVNNGYNTIRLPNLDYFLTGRVIETERFFGGTDNLLYDYFSGSFFAVKHTGNILNIPNINNEYWIFKNGQKLVKNLDYNLIGSNFILNNVPVDEENYFIIKQVPNNFNYTSGDLGFLKLKNNFNNNTSQVYYNGIKQKINSDYVENSSFDIIFDNFYEKNSLHKIIYNNTDDFFV